MMLALVLAGALAGMPAAVLAAAKPPAKKPAKQADAKGSRPKLNSKRQGCVKSFLACRSRCDSARGVRALAACKQKNNCFTKYHQCRGGQP